MSLPRLMRVAGSRLLADPLPGVEALADWCDVALQPGSTCLAEDGRRMMLQLRAQVAEGPLVLGLFASAGGAWATVLTLPEAQQGGGGNLPRAHSAHGGAGRRTG